MRTPRLAKFSDPNYNPEDRKKIVKQRKAHLIRHPGKRYSDQIRVKVVTAYLTLGTAPLVSALTGVPIQTIRHWKMERWWKDMVSEIQAENNQEQDSKLSKIIAKTHDIIDDRLQNGDIRLDREGNVFRIPVSIKDVTLTSRELFQQRKEIRKEPETHEQEATQADRLLKLAEQFTQFAKAVKGTNKEEKVIEGEIVEDAVHEEREEGLQDGVQEVPLQVRSDQESLGTELSQG